jgi:hypothetical protein
MIRQAHTYLVSAMSGATLIAIAIVAFVLLVSAQVFRDWPIAALGGGNKPHISDSRVTSSPSAATTTTAAGADKSAAQRSAGSRADGGETNGAATDQTQVSDSGLAPSAGPTATTSPVESGDQTGSGGDQGSNTTASAPAQNPGGSGSGQSSSSTGGNSGSGSSTASTPTGKLTETVHNTVNQVDETVTGGALEKSGVTQATEGVVNGVVGPESPVGKAVDGAVETVTGLLGGKP